MILAMVSVVAGTRMHLELVAHLGRTAILGLHPGALPIECAVQIRHTATVTIVVPLRGARCTVLSHFNDR
jgi:hypothetical protein